MSSGKRLRIPFRRKESQSSSPSPPFSNTTANTPNTTILNNVISGSLIRTNASSSIRIANSSRPANISGDKPTLVQNEAFQKATQEYIDHLSDDDKVAFQSATDIMEKLGELQQGRFRISSSHTTRVQKVQKVLQCVKQFLGSIAICIQHHPEISSLVVGGLNCILTVGTFHQSLSFIITNIGQLALGYIEFFESLTDMMERIGDHLTYLSKYSITFQNSEEVQKVRVMYCNS